MTSRAGAGQTAGAEGRQTMTAEQGQTEAGQTRPADQQTRPAGKGQKVGRSAGHQLA